MQWVHAQATVETVTTVQAILGRSLSVDGAPQGSLSEVTFGASADMLTRAVVYCAWCALWKGCPRDVWRNGTCPVQWVHAQATVETVSTVRAIMGRALVPWVAQTRLAHNVNAAQAADMLARAVVYCSRSAL